MKILLFDIETSPMLSYIWSLWDETRSMEKVENDWYVMSWSAKWLGDKKTIVKALPDYPSYKKDKQNDKLLLKDLWDLLDEADIVIGHNSMKFDCRKVNARFLSHNMTPPSPYRSIDTLKQAKAHFNFTSNKLNDLGVALGVGKKIPTGGFELWRGCLNDNRKSWALMKKYNKQDVDLLEKIYLKMRPYMKNHPNISLDDVDDRIRCPACGSYNIQRRGYSYTNSSKFARLHCEECGKWSRAKINEIDKGDRKNIAANIM